MVWDKYSYNYKPVKIRNRSKTVYNAILPPLCPRCSFPLKRGSKQKLCRWCKRYDIEFYFDNVHPFGIYDKRLRDDPLCKAIRNFKDTSITPHKKRKHIYRRIFKKLMEYSVLFQYPTLKNNDIVGFVPMTKRKVKSRGFNHAAVLAEDLSKLINKPFINKLLTCTKQIPDLRKLKLSERIKAIKGAFQSNHNVQNQKVVIVDDILTSGNTANECARILKNSGASQVNIFILGRTYA